MKKKPENLGTEKTWGQSPCFQVKGKETRWLSPV